MIYEIQKLDQSITEHVGQDRSVDEVLFNLAVELGRALERNKIENFTPDFLDKKLDALPTISQQDKIDKINSILHQAVLRAHLDHLKSEGALSYSSGDNSFLPQLTEEIQRKHGISFLDARREDEGIDLIITFSLSGKLKKIFEQNGFEPVVHTKLASSSGDEEEIISTEKAAQNNFYSTFIDFHRAELNYKIEQIDSLLVALERFNLFFTLSES